MFTPLKYENLDSIRVRCSDIINNTLSFNFETTFFRRFINKKIYFTIGDKLLSGIYRPKTMNDNTTHTIYDVSDFSYIINNLRIGNYFFVLDTFSITDSNELVTIQDILDNLVSSGAYYKINDNDNLDIQYSAISKDGLLNIFDKSKLDKYSILLESPPLTITDSYKNLFYLRVDSTNNPKANFRLFSPTTKDIVDVEINIGDYCNFIMLYVNHSTLKLEYSITKYVFNSTELWLGFSVKLYLGNTGINVNRYIGISNIDYIKFPKNLTPTSTEIYQLNNNDSFIIDSTTISISNKQLITNTGSGEVINGVEFASRLPLSTVEDLPVDFFKNGIFKWELNDLTSKALFDLNNLMKKLIPEPPAGLTNTNLTTTTSYYSALRCVTGILTNKVFDVIPILNSQYFYDGDNGDVIVILDGVTIKDISLTENDDTQTTDILKLTEFDASVVSILPNFYKVLLAQITIVSLTESNQQKTIVLKHTLTGETNPFNFDFDTPKTNHNFVFGSNLIFTANTVYISGVPSLKTGDSINIDFTLNNFVSTHYANIIARLTSNVSNPVNINPSRIYTIDELSDTLNNGVIILANQYSENVVLTGNSYNSKSNASPLVNLNTGCRVDTKSVETRIKTTTLGIYDSTKSLMDSNYLNELQLLNGYYQSPVGNYTLNLPVPGPDYTVNTTPIRYATFNVGSISLKTGFTLSINNALNFNNIETDNLIVLVKIGSETGWLDANKSYPGVGSPVNDNDACMVYGSSSASVKRVTLGSTPRTGNIYVSIGLKLNSNMKFSSITLSNIS